jgi:TolB-like protein
MDFEVPEEEKKVVSVYKFEDRSIGTTKFKPWQTGIPDMIMQSLSAIPYFKVMSRQYIQEQVLSEQQFQLFGHTDEKSAVELGRLLNADYIITGAFSVFEETLQVNARCISVESGEIVGQAQAHGELGNFYTLQNRVAVQITENMNLFVSEDAEEMLAERTETTVIEASLANYEGEEKMEEIAVLEKKGEKEKVEEVKEEAKKDFERALDYDKDYEKAKRNLSKLALAIPMTL